MVTSSTASSRSLRNAGRLKAAKSSNIAPSILGTASRNTSASNSKPYAVASSPAFVKATAMAKRNRRITGGRLRCGRWSSAINSVYWQSSVPCMHAWERVGSSRLVDNVLCAMQPGSVAVGVVIQGGAEWRGAQREIVARTCSERSLHPIEVSRHYYSCKTNYDGNH